MLVKTQSLRVDCVTYDLEDSVIPSKKEEARTILRKFLQEPHTPGITEHAVRINPVASKWAEDDLVEVVTVLTHNLWHELTVLAQGALHRYARHPQSELRLRP